MKGLTIRQPWATLVARGRKRIVTRGYRTSYRGPVLIHAGASPQSWREMDDPSAWEDRDAVQAILSALDLIADDGSWPSPIVDPTGYLWGPGIHFQDVLTLPLGAVVAVAELVDVVPIIAGDLAEISDGPRIETHADAEDFPDGWLDLYHETLGSPSGSPLVYGRSIPDEAPLGDYTPGRFGWLLGDVRPLAEPVYEVEHVLRDGRRKPGGALPLWDPTPELVEACS